MNWLFGRFVTGPGSVGLLALRLVAGLAFMIHGSGKIVHPFSWMGPDSGTPAVLQALAAISEFGGGLAWILGLLTPIASFGIFCTMVVATWTKISGGASFVKGDDTYELPLLYLAVAVLFMLIGPGALSLDALIFGRGRGRYDR